MFEIYKVVLLNTESVSYTHLDVYKRQEQGIADYENDPLDYLQQWAKLGYLRRYYDIGDEPVFDLTPVSYTHLDVYKRQPMKSVK